MRTPLMTEFGFAPGAASAPSICGCATAQAANAAARPINSRRVVGLRMGCSVCMIIRKKPQNSSGTQLCATQEQTEGTEPESNAKDAEDAENQRSKPLIRWSLGQPGAGGRLCCHLRSTGGNKPNVDLSNGRAKILPLLGGEGRGEGEFFPN